MEFNNQTFTQFRKDLKDAVKDLEKKYNITVNDGQISYDDYEFSMTLKVKKNLTASETKERYANFPLYGKTFVDGRHSFKVVGYKPNTKYSVVCERDDGKSMLYTYNYANELIFGGK